MDLLQIEVTRTAQGWQITERIGHGCFPLDWKSSKAAALRFGRARAQKLGALLLVEDAQ